MEDVKQLPSGRDFKPAERVDLRLMRGEWIEEQQGKTAKAWLRARFKRIWMAAVATGGLAFAMVEYADKIHDFLLLISSTTK